MNRIPQGFDTSWRDMCTYRVRTLFGLGALTGWSECRKGWPLGGTTFSNMGGSNGTTWAPSAKLCLETCSIKLYVVISKSLTHGEQQWAVLLMVEEGSDWAHFEPGVAKLVDLVWTYFQLKCRRFTRTIKIKIARQPLLSFVKANYPKMKGLRR